MNFGQGEAGLGAWPRAKSSPVAEYCTVFSVSTPMALDALPMTAPASCADVVHPSTAANANPARHFFNMVHRLSTVVLPTSSCYCEVALTLFLCALKNSKIAARFGATTSLWLPPGTSMYFVLDAELLQLRHHRARALDVDRRIGVAVHDDLAGCA